MDRPDYGDLIAQALSDTTGNGYRLEAAARASHALLFHEAAAACEMAHGRGFPLAIDVLGEQFSVTVGGPLGPRFEFKRDGQTLTTTAFQVADAAVDPGLTGTWKPGELPVETARAKVAALMGRAVQALARDAGLRRR